MTRCRGISLAEYALALGLVVLIGLMGLMAFGSAMSQALPGLVSFQGAPAVTGANPAASSAVGSGLPSQGNSGVNAYRSAFARGNVRLSNGTVVQMPKIVDTTAGYGERANSTHGLARAVLQMARALDQEDPGLSADLRKLAVNGFTLAEQQLGLGHSLGVVSTDAYFGYHNRGYDIDYDYAWGVSDRISRNQSSYSETPEEMKIQLRVASRLFSREYQAVLAELPKTRLTAQEKKVVRLLGQVIVDYAGAATQSNAQQTTNNTNQIYSHNQVPID
ncbi:MAG: hypothetical protein SFZ03_04590 [Candidatus Melainabacteria bacterium]|nr:hypothetical protein [Candidatus Melainabacteria bacterium]